MMLYRFIPALLPLLLACSATDLSSGKAADVATDVAEDTSRPGLEDTADGGSVADTSADTAADSSDTAVADTEADSTADTAADTMADSGADTASDTGTADTGSIDTSGDTAVSCDEGETLYAGVRLVDRNGDPLEEGDLLDVTIEVMGSGPATAGELRLESWSIAIDADSFAGTGLELSGSLVTGPRATLQTDALRPGRITGTAMVVSTSELAGLTVSLHRERCELPRSRAAAVLQAIGGGSKIPFCIDAAEYRSLQVAPAVTLRSTQQYLTANGARNDLFAENFIFCPQAPTIVHQVELCITRAPGQTMTLAGSYAGGGQWEVDDFALFETRSRGVLFADGFTTQHHPGDNNFWCGALGEPAGHLCPASTGCVASLREVATGRMLTPIATTEALAPTLRRFDDGAVHVESLLPDDGRSVDLTVTALDTGIEGNLGPGLYLLMGPP
jgi:hypothetical protein